MASYTQADVVALQKKNDQKMGATLVIEHGNTQKELMEARLLIEAMESKQIHLIKELQLMQEQNHMYMEILSKKDKEEEELLLKLGSDYPELEDLEKQNKVLVMEWSEDIKGKALQAKLDKLTKDLEEARLLNCRYEKDQASQFSQQNQVELVREQVEVETSRTILHLQDEVTALQLDLDERLCCLTQENMRLRDTIAAKEEEMKTFHGEWERAILELTNFLVEGSKSLKDASGQIESIVCSFPQVDVWISEHVERAAKACIDKEETILQLEKSLEDAQNMVAEMEMQLNSLREATIALNELPQLDNDESTTEAIHLSKLLYEKINMVNMLESKLKIKEDCFSEVEKRADAAFLVVKWLSDRHKVAQNNGTERGIHISQPFSSTKMDTHKTSEMKTDENPLNMHDIEAQVELESLILESQNAIDAFYMDVEGHIAALKRDVLETSTTFLKLGGDLVKEICEMRSNFMELKGNHMGFESSTVNLQALESLKFLKFENWLQILHPIRDALANMNDRLTIINDSVDRITSAHCCPLADEYIAEADGWNADNSTSGYSTSASDFSTESVLENKLDGISYTCHSKFSGKISELQFPKGSVVETELEDSKKQLKISHHSEAMILGLRKDLDMVFDAFNKLYVHLTTILDENDMVDFSYPEGTCFSKLFYLRIIMRKLY